MRASKCRLYMYIPLLPPPSSLPLFSTSPLSPTPPLPPSLPHPHTIHRCSYNLDPLWKASLRNSPLVATPTFFDVDGDGYGDIVAPSFSGEVWSIHGESGHIVDNWPFYLEEKAFHASPLLVSQSGRPHAL